MNFRISILYKSNFNETKKWTKKKRQTYYSIFVNANDLSQIKFSSKTQNSSQSGPIVTCQAKNIKIFPTNQTLISLNYRVNKLIWQAPLTKKRITKYIIQKTKIVQIPRSLADLSNLKVIDMLLCEKRENKFEMFWKSFESVYISRLIFSEKWKIKFRISFSFSVENIKWHHYKWKLVLKSN